MSITAREVPEWTLGDRLRKAREHRHLQQAEMAELLGVAQTALSKWEADQRRPRDLLDIVEKWARVTGVPREWLMWGVIPPDADPTVASLIHHPLQRTLLRQVPVVGR